MTVFFEQIYSYAKSGELFLFLTLLYLAVIAIERAIFFLKRKGQYNDKDGASNVAIAAITSYAETLIFSGIFISAYLFVYEHFRIFDLANTWLTWAVIFLAHDFCYYLDHRISHRVGLFWAFHHVHHSSNEMNFTVAARGTMFLKLVQPTYLLLAVLGLDLIQFAIIKVFKNLWGIFNHTQLVTNMGVLEHVLCTPSVHRVHHGTQPKYIDKNFGQVLSVWDKMLGTFQKEDEEPQYGLVSPLNTYNPIKAHYAGLVELYLKMSRVGSWRLKLLCLIKPPDWLPTDADHV